MTSLQDAARNAIKLLEELRGISYLKYEHTAIENSAKELRTALAQHREQQPVCHGCGIPAGDVHMSTCKSGKWPSRVSNGDTAAPAPQPAQGEPVYQYQMADGSWIDQIKDSYDYNRQYAPNATVRVVYTSAPAPQPVQGEPTGCACRWDADDNRVATCARHQGWLDVVHEWAERAKAAEAALQSAQPKQEPLRELTDEEILSLEKQTPAMNDAGEEWIYFARAVLKKARE